MITKLKKTMDLINSCLIFLSILTFSISANAWISDSATIYLISKLLKTNKLKHEVTYKYPLDVEEYSFTMRVTDPKDYYIDKRINKPRDDYYCRFSIFKDGTTKIEYFNDIFKGFESKPEEEFLDSVNKYSNEFKESLKRIVRYIKFKHQESPYAGSFVTFEPKINIKNNGKHNFHKAKVTNGGGIL